MFKKNVKKAVSKKKETSRKWTLKEDQILCKNVAKLTYAQIGEKIDRTSESVRKRWARIN